jgi:hypothetical protein
LEGLLFCHESAFYAESFLRDRLSALVGEFLGLVLIVFFENEFQNSLVTLTDGQRPYHLLER